MRNYEMNYRPKPGASDASDIQAEPRPRPNANFNPQISRLKSSPAIIYIKDLSVPPPRSCVPIIRKPKLKVIKAQTKQETPTMAETEKESLKIPKECERNPGGLGMGLRMATGGVIWQKGLHVAAGNGKSPFGPLGHAAAAPSPELPA